MVEKKNCEVIYLGLISLYHKSLAFKQGCVDFIFLYTLDNLLCVCTLQLGSIINEKRHSPSTYDTNEGLSNTDDSFLLALIDRGSPALGENQGSQESR